jgi:hypothetical protein
LKNALEIPGFSLRRLDQGEGLPFEAGGRITPTLCTADPARNSILVRDEPDGFPYVEDANIATD